MSSKGAAAIWLVISLLGILIVAELGLGYFFVKNKEKLAKKEELVSKEQIRMDFAKEIEPPIEFIDHFDGPNKDREIFRNVYFEDDGEQFQPKLGFGKNIYFAGGYAREPALTFIPNWKEWTEGTVDFWVNSIDDYISDAKYLIHFTPRPNLIEGEKSTGFVSEYIAAILLDKERRIVVRCNGFENVNSIKSTSPIPIREWAHVVLTWSRAGGFTRLYINNELEATTSESCDLISNGNIYPWLNGYGGYFGWMDELKISNVAETF